MNIPSTASRACWIGPGGKPSRLETSVQTSGEPSGASSHTSLETKLINVSTLHMATGCTVCRNHVSSRAGPACMLRYAQQTVKALVPVFFLVRHGFEDSRLRHNKRRCLGLGAAHCSQRTAGAA